MTSRYQYISDLAHNSASNGVGQWKMHVLVTRTWTSSNPTNNRILSDDMILVDEQRSLIHAMVPNHLRSKFSFVEEGRVYMINRFSVLAYNRNYRPLDRDKFVQFVFNTIVKPVTLPAQSFPRYAFEFFPFEKIPDREDDDKYLTDVVGQLLKWGPVKKQGGKLGSRDTNIRKIVIFDLNNRNMNVTLWGAATLVYDDEEIKAKHDTNVVVILTGCMVRKYRDVIHLSTSTSTRVYLDLPIHEVDVFKQRPLQPVTFLDMDPVDGTLEATSVCDIFKRLPDHVEVGTLFIIQGHIIGVDLANDWKYVRCSTCLKSVVWRDNVFFCDKKCKRNASNPHLAYKLVLRVHDKGQLIDCTVFDSEAVKILGLTAEELHTKSLNEGADNLNWIEDYFLGKIIGDQIALGIWIDPHNLRPTCVTRFSVTKFYSKSIVFPYKQDGEFEQMDVSGADPVVVHATSSTFNSFPNEHADFHTPDPKSSLPNISISQDNTRVQENAKIKQSDISDSHEIPVHNSSSSNKDLPNAIKRAILHVPVPQSSVHNVSQGNGQIQQPLEQLHIIRTCCLSEIDSSVMLYDVPLYQYELLDDTQRFLYPNVFFATSASRILQHITNGPVKPTESSNQQAASIDVNHGECSTHYGST